VQSVQELAHRSAPFLRNILIVLSAGSRT
jgi:hypothetical protein